MTEDTSELTLLAAADTIAAIVLSRSPSRGNHLVADHLQRNGYRTVPIASMVDRILDERAWASNAHIPENLAEEYSDPHVRTGGGLL